MPKPAKVLDNIEKNLTKAERDARAEAEAETLPSRSRVSLRRPAYVTRDNDAKKYWDETLKRMDGITLLDDLDTEMLAIYCTMLSRRDKLNDLCRQLLAESLKDKKAPAEDRLDAVGQLDGLMGKLAVQERTILQFAEKLGLTPSGRVRLARKRAEERLIEEADELFGG